MDVFASRIIFLLVDGLSVLGALAVVLAAVFASFQLTKAKQSAVGGWLLVIARLGVLGVALGYLMMNLVITDLGMEGIEAVSLVLRGLLLVAYLVTIPALLMIRPAKEVARG